MKIEDARLAFVQGWGTLGTAWGIPRSMAQIHALLLCNPESLSTEDVMETIQLSRGNVNTNMRELIHWNLVKKQHKLGERKEFFAADQEIWSIAQHIVNERKRRELVPVQQLVKELRGEMIEGTPNEVKHFQAMLKDLDEFLDQMNTLADMAIKLNSNVLFKRLLKMLS